MYDKQINDFLQGRPVDPMDLRIAVHHLVESHKLNLQRLRNNDLLNDLDGNQQEKQSHTFVCSCGDTHDLQFVSTVLRPTIRSILNIIYDKLEKPPCLLVDTVPQRYDPNKESPSDEY